MHLLCLEIDILYTLAYSRNTLIYLDYLYDYAHKHLKG